MYSARWNLRRGKDGRYGNQFDKYRYQRVFLHEREWAQATKAVPSKDFNYVVLNYQNTDYPDSLINLEKKYWEPFIKATMDKGQTPQVAWGNTIVLAPRGDNIKFTLGFIRSLQNIG